MSAPHYRRWVTGRDLVSFQVTVNETDLYVRATRNLKGKAERIVRKYRLQLERYIERHPVFRTALTPLAPTEDAPLIVKAMLDAANRLEVGPMAAVAGAIAEFVGSELTAYAPEIIIENGGDVFLKTAERRVVGIYAGDSPFGGKIGLEIDAEDTPMGICTSSGTVGHSLSLGKADAVVVLSPSATLADAAATAIGNIVTRVDDIEHGVEFARRVEGIDGVVIVKGDKIGTWGNVRLCHTAVKTA